MCTICDTFSPKNCQFRTYFRTYIDTDIDINTNIDIDINTNIDIDIDIDININILKLMYIEYIF